MKKIRIKNKTRDFFQILAVIISSILILFFVYDLFLLRPIEPLFIKLVKILLLAGGIGTFIVDSWFLIKT